MTIALGFLTPSHIIFAADSQESLGGGMKADMDKIGFHSSLFKDEAGENKTHGVIVTGAGSSEYLRHLCQKIVEWFETRTPTVAEFDRYLRAMIRLFYERHVTPHTSVDLGIELIVSAQANNERSMWATYMSTVTRNDSYSAVGSGSAWAREVIRGFIPALVDEHSATVMAAYAAFTAKLHSDGCGLDTRIVSIARNGGLNFADAAAVRKAEELFRRYDGYMRVCRLGVMGMPTKRMPPDAETFLGDFRQEVANINFYPVPQWAIDLARQQFQESPKGDQSPPQPSQESPGGSGES